MWPELRRRAATVRFRVTALAAVAMALVLGGTGVALAASQRRLLAASLEEALEIAADTLALDVAEGAQPATLPPVVDDDGVAQVVRAGAVVASTANLAGRPPIAPPPGTGRRSVVRSLGEILPDEDAFQVVSRPVDTPGGPASVHVGAPLDDIDDAIETLAASLLVVVPAAAAVLAGLVWLLVGRTLRPVEAIRAEVAAIGAAALDRRVSDPGTDDEVGRLARTMNAMLDRVEHGVRRQQQFVADASHELRSPLTRIRSELEVDLAHPDGADASRLRSTHRSVLEETAGLAQLVEDLLLLARDDAGAASPLPRAEAVDLDDIVLDHARRVRAAGRVTVDLAGVSGAQVRGDSGQLGRMVGNLMDNAARYAAGVVAVTLAERGGSVVLSVGDDGPGIPPEERDRVFERFARLDPSRAAGTGGAGLGLAIARDIVERHGGTIVIAPEGGPGTRVVVTLPL